MRDVGDDVAGEPIAPMPEDAPFGDDVCCVSA